MKATNTLLALMLGLFLVACNSEGTSESDSGQSISVSSQEQAELVAAALMSDQGGVGDDITIITQAADGQPQQQVQRPNAVYNYSVTVNVDYYDAQDHLQDSYDPETTDRIDYDSQILGEITEGEGFFSELHIDNRSDFTVDEILSRTVWINGIHTNHSTYSRTEHVTQAEINFQLDCELVVTDLTVDLDAGDTFPESGTIEGTMSGSYERIGPYSQQTYRFSFHFIATYIGDNTVEIELDDGTVYIVQLASGSVQRIQ